MENVTTQTQGPSGPKLQEKASAGYIYLVTAVAAVGGFLFGFDTAIIAGAIGFISQHFRLNSWQEGLAAGSALIGCMLGASVAGTLSDKLGRKKVLGTAAVLFVVTAILAAIPRTVNEFMAARLLMGIAVGVESMLSPLYIAEIAPSIIRGRLVTLNHVALMIGMLCAYCVALHFSSLSLHVNWRYMFASGSVPAAIFLFALISVPESPRWLSKQGFYDRALAILAKVGGRQHAEAEMVEIKEAISQESGSIFQLFQPGLRTALIVGVVLAIFQQITGINVILYYAPEVFKKAGLPIKEALIGSILVGIVNLIANIIAVFIIDRVGRKPLFLWGTAGMCLFLILTGVSFKYPEIFPAKFTMFFVFGYVATFMIGLGPGFWTILSELFPTRIRGRAMSIATFNIWFWCFIITLTFPTLLEKLGGPFTFWLYALMCVFTIIFTWVVVPETKGKTLEEIERFWMKRAHK